MFFRYACTSNSDKWNTAFGYSLVSFLAPIHPLPLCQFQSQHQAETDCEGKRKVTTIRYSMSEKVSNYLYTLNHRCHLRDFEGSELMYIYIYIYPTNLRSLLRVIQKHRRQNKLCENRKGM